MPLNSKAPKTTSFMPLKSKAPRHTSDGGEAKKFKSNLAPSTSAASTSAASSRVYDPLLNDIQKTIHVVKAILTEATEILCHNLDPTDMLGTLKSRGVLRADDIRRIERKDTTTQMVVKLMDTLKKKPLFAYNMFMDVLHSKQRDMYAVVRKIERKHNYDSSGKFNDIDICDVTTELSGRELHTFYTQLDLHHRTVEEVEKNANDTGDVDFRARAVLNYWRQKAGRAATRKVVLDALLKCNLIQARENLSERWGAFKATAKPSRSFSASTAQLSNSSYGVNAKPSRSSSASTAKPPSSSSASTAKLSRSSSASTAKPSSSSSASTAKLSRSSSASTAKPSSSSSASTDKMSRSSSASTAKPSSSSSDSTAKLSSSSSVSSIAKPSSSSSASTAKPSSSCSASPAKPSSLSSAGFPDMLLLWIAIVRQVNDILRRHINPTGVARSVLTEDDSNKIALTERNEGRLQAVNQLIDQLLTLKDLHWTNSFPSALKEQHPEVFDAVTKAREHFYREDMFSRCRYTVCDTISSSGGVLELEEFGVRLEIPAGAIQGKEDIAVTVVSSKDNHPPLGDKFIVAPIVQLEPCGLQFLRPVRLTVRHAGVDLISTNLQLWKRSRNNVVFDGEGGSTDPNIYLTETTVTVRQTSFCWMFLIGYCSLDVQILPFIDKDLIPNTVTLTIFAVADKYAKIIVEDKERKGKEDLAYPTQRYLLKPCKSLKVEITGVKDWDDKGSWEVTKRPKDTDEAPNKKKITSKELQLGNRYSCCRFLITKLLPEVNSIWCDLEIRQNKSSTLRFRMKHRVDKTRMQMLNSGVHKACRACEKTPPPSAPAQPAPALLTATPSGNASDKLTDKDIRTITHKSDLTRSQLLNLFQELDLKDHEIENAEMIADIKDFKLQAGKVLRRWRSTKGEDATKGAILKAMKESDDLKEVMESLMTTWNVSFIYI